MKPFDSTIVPASVKSDGLMLYIRDKYMIQNRNYLSAFDASEGTLYLIFVAALLMHPRTPNTFALDNVDGTLNADLVRKLTSAIVKACDLDEGAGSARAYQSFVTSHHPSSLDSFDIFCDTQRIFVTRRSLERPAIGSTYFDQLKPPVGVDKGEWMARNDGKMLSELLLDDKIPGALR